MASSGDCGPVEVLVLGPPIVRVGGGAPLVLTRALAKTVILLAARGGPVRLGEFTKELAVGDNSVHQNISKLRKLDIPIAHTGRGDTGEYHLDPAGCLIDAQEFARGADGQDIDAMLRLWRGPLPEFPQFLRKGLDAPCWATVKAARSRIIQRISELSEADRPGLAELPRFAGLFPGDQEVDRIRLSAPDAKPRLQAADAENPAQAAQQQLTLTVNPAPPLSITTTSLPAATAAAGYSQQLAAAGGAGAYTWRLASGTLPAGLILSSSGRLWTGDYAVTAAPGTYDFTVQAADGESPAQTAQQQLTLTVHATPLAITTKTLPAATAGTGYRQQLAAAGGVAPYTWTLASGRLPAGITLSRSGLISGTPASSGTSTFTVQAADAENPAQTAHQQFTLTVHAAPLLITTRSLPNASVDHAYTQQLRATGGTGPYTWTLASGRLPAGITLSREGALHGEPWAAGTYVFTVRATDSQWPAKSVTQWLSITVAGERADLAVSVTGPSSATAGSRVTYTVTVKDNGPAWASRVSVSLDTDGLTDVRASDAGRVKLAESRDVAQASAAWYAAGLAPGQTLTFTVTGTVPAKGLKDISAIGQIQSPTSDPNPRNNTSTVTTKVR